MQNALTQVEFRGTYPDLLVEEDQQHLLDEHHPVVPPQQLLVHHSMNRLCVVRYLTHVGCH